MPRARSPNREKAKQLYIESYGSMRLIDIATELGVSDSQIRKWKSQGNWEDELKVTLPITNSNVTNQVEKKNDEGNQNINKKPGAPKNSKNASGHGAPKQNKNAVGHGAPIGNKNRLTTGEFETLFFDTLDREEHCLVKVTPKDKLQLLHQEIQLLTVRERRMLKRIEELKKYEFTNVENKTIATDDKYIEMTKSQATLGQMQFIEDALTRVQARKQKAIDSLHKYGYEDTYLEIETMKVELGILKQDTQDDPEMEEDGFLDAMNAEVDKVWGNADDSC